MPETKNAAAHNGKAVFTGGIRLLYDSPNITIRLDQLGTCGISVSLDDPSVTSAFLRFGVPLMPIG